MRPFLTPTLLLLTLAVEAQVPANGRRIGYLMNTAEDGNTGAALGLAEAACVEGAHKTLLWSAVQSAIGTWDAGELMALDLLNLQSAVQSVPRSLQIAVTNTARNEVPVELNAYPYDHPAMVAAFTVYLDTLFAHIPDMPLVYLNIGMESDIMWGGDALQYQRFGNFLAHIGALPARRWLLFCERRSVRRIAVRRRRSWRGSASGSQRNRSGVAASP